MQNEASEPTFSETLTDVYLFLFFRLYLEINSQHHLLSFWAEVEHFKSTIDQEAKIARARKIYKHYLIPNSKRQIEADIKIISEILSHITNGENKLFAPLIIPIQSKLDKDLYPKFLKSEHYKLYLKMKSENQFRRGSEVAILSKKIITFFSGKEKKSPPSTPRSSVDEHKSNDKSIPVPNIKEKEKMQIDFHKLVHLSKKEGGQIKKLRSIYETEEEKLKKQKKKDW